MVAEKSVAVIFCTLLSAAAYAQQPDVLPTEHVAIIPPGGLVDLDTGCLLPQRDFRGMRADLRFDRDGAGFYLEPLAGGVPARVGDVEPGGDWQSGRVRIERRSDGFAVLFARTDHGVARVQLLVADPYSTASAALRWSVVPPKHPVFLPPPTDLAARWEGQQLLVTWTGEQPLWLVEVHTGDKVQKLTAQQPSLRIDGLSTTEVHRILVRGVTAAHDVTLPGEVVQFGPRQQPKRGAVDYPARWYDQCGGLRLGDGSAAVEDAAVVFYLYGVTVPGGGVQKVGVGERAYVALSELPAGPYPPVHGRLDDGDVLAVQLPDGRYGKLWLQSANGDLRDGMRVHFAFLVDGRRQLLAAPAEPVAETKAGAVKLHWGASPSAVQYRVAIGGRAQPLLAANTEVLIGDLPPNRLFEAVITALGADGEESDGATVLLHTYGAGARLGQFRLEAQRGGFLFASAATVANVADADLALTGGAGGASVLRFDAGHGAASGGQLSFGEFPDEARLEFKPQLSSDSRQPDSDRFLVRTVDGIAWVRIIERSWPEPKFEYVWLPR